MAVEIKNTGRTREVTGSIYLERWVQIDAGTALIYTDLDTLDALADSLTVSGQGRVWYGAPSPGEYDAGETNKAWYGQVVRVPFMRLQASGEWVELKAAVLGFVEAAFPGELILEANKRFERPLPGDPGSPAKYVLWTIEYD